MQESRVLSSDDHPHEFVRYDRLAEMVGNPPSDHSALTALAAEVAADYRGRERERVLASKRRRSVQRPLEATSLRTFQLEFIVWLAAFVLWSIIGQNPWLAALVVAAAVLTLVIRAMRKHRAMQNARNGIPANQPCSCLACRYDLTGLPDSIPHEWIAAHVGPRRCPECGEPWPLVPRSG